MVVGAVQSYPNCSLGPDCCHHGGYWWHFPRLGVSRVPCPTRAPCLSSIHIWYAPTTSPVHSDSCVVVVFMGPTSMATILWCIDHLFHISGSIAKSKWRLLGPKDGWTSPHSARKANPKRTSLSNIYSYIWEAFRTLEESTSGHKSLWGLRDWSSCTLVAILDQGNAAMRMCPRGQVVLQLESPVLWRHRDLRVTEVVIVDQSQRV